MSVSYEGIGHLSVTMPAMGCVQGAVCGINTVGYAKACSAGDKFIGMVEEVDGIHASVQLEGFVKTSYTGTHPTVGFACLAADGAGNVAVNANGREYLVVSVDANSKTLVFKL